MKIERSKDCGNSPKNRFVEDVAVDVETGDAESLASKLLPDVVWEVVGAGRIEGRENVLARLDPSASRSGRLAMDQVLSHGRAGAATGAVWRKGRPSRRFCHVIELGSTKGDSVRRLTSYAVEL